jgi:sterol 3beta-glucosyltransferase
LKVLILSWGSRGDVEPCLALAVGLQKAGHRVTLAAPRIHADWIESYGVAAHPMRFDVSEFFHEQKVQTGGSPLKLVRRLRAQIDGMRTGILQSLDDYWQAGSDADFVLQTGQATGGVEIAAQRGIPMAFAYPYPFTPTRAFPAFFGPWRFSLGGRFNLWTQRAALRNMWIAHGPPLNHWRAARFHLPPWRSYPDMLNSRRDVGAPCLNAYSSNVLPRPADWDESHHVTGFWFLDPPPNWQPPADLLRFLDEGPPPVYVGFGSAGARDPENLTRQVLRALEMTGQRGILLAGGGRALARLPAPSTVLYVQSVPHRWLYPRVAAVVHHGGPGTMAAALLAGIPGIIAPLVIDQHAWARITERLGVGLRVATMRTVNAEELAPAIGTAVSDTNLRARAAAMGEKIRAENGVACAVEIVERYARDFADRRRARQQ